MHEVDWQVSSKAGHNGYLLHFVLANLMWFIHMVFLHVALENCYEHRHSHVYSSTFSVYGYLAWMLDTEIDSINQYWRSF